MLDIFDQKIICKNCDSEMKKDLVVKRGVELRSVKCLICDDVIIHPADLGKLEQYKGLKGKVFNVKLRMVGNSHAVSIPKEIVNFMNDMHRGMRKEMDDMVRLCFDDFHKLSLRFGEERRNHNDR
jgi:hypothetical protein